MKLGVTKFSFWMTTGMLATWPAFADTAAVNYPDPARLPVVNLLDNPEMMVQQRTGTAPTAVNTTATYWPDRWAAYSNNASASVSLSIVSTSLPTGFQNAFRIQRASANTNLTQICAVQEVPTSDVTPFAGQYLQLSYYANVGANFSGAASQMQTLVTTGTGTDEGLATLISGWTGGASTVNNSLTTVSATWQRYATAPFLVPQGASELAVQLCWTPTGTAGANDWMQLTGVQLEPALSSTVATPTNYWHRPLVVESQNLFRYFWQLNEWNGLVNAQCAVTAANVETCALAPPRNMRAAPTVTVTAGGWQFVIDGAAGAAITTMAAATSAIDSIVITGANTATAAVHAVALRGSGATGKIVATADF